MSMSMHTIGLRDPNDPNHQIKVEAAVALRNAKIGVLPKELAEYFKTTDSYEAASNPDSAIQVDITAATRSHKAEMEEGFEIDISKLPAGVKVIRFVCSY